MNVIIHRGTHQIGGIAVEIRTATAWILIDMGEELSLDPEYVPMPLSIPGVTNEDGSCDAVLFTHYHGDHTGQLSRIRVGIPLYMGSLAKEVLKRTDRSLTPELLERVKNAQVFQPGKPFEIGDIQVTPFSIDHSAADSYMFLIEAAGRKLLYTGDFRLHGFRGKGIPKILEKHIGKVDVLITEGTTLSRLAESPISERDLQGKIKDYIRQYKYVFILGSSTQLERICAISKAVPRGKYFLCDAYQAELLDLVETMWGHYSPMYRNIKKTVYGENLLENVKERGFVMMVRDNKRFRQILPMFDQKQSILLYSMWDGYRTREGSTIPDFLELAGTWAYLHTSGHASTEDIQRVIGQVSPDIIIPMHTDKPEALQTLYPNKTVILLADGEEFVIP